MNPLIRRYRDSGMKAGQLWIHGVVYAVVVGLMVFIASSIAKTPGGAIKVQQACRIIYYELLVVQVIMLWFWAAYNAGSAIPEEVAHKSYDFFRLLPLSASQKIAGIAVGRNLLPLVLGALTLAVMTLAGLVGGIGLSQQAQVLLVLASVATTFPLVALLSSTTVRKTPSSGRNHGVLGLLALVFFAAPVLTGFIHLAEEMGSSKFADLRLTFFGHRLLAMPFVSVLALCLSVWAYTGIRRRFTREREPLFTSRGLVGFYLYFLAILLGFTWHVLPEERVGGLVLTCATGAAAALFPVGRMLRFGDYQELRRADGLGGNGTTGWGWLLRRANPVPWLAVFGIWAACGWYVLGLSLQDPLHNLAFIGVASTFLLFLCAIFEVSALYSQDNPKLNFLLWFIAIVQVIVPLILAAALEMPSIVGFSPLGYFGIAIHSADRSVERLPDLSVAIATLNLALTAVACMPIVRRYRSLI